jgi:hypothetical protein
MVCSQVKRLAPFISPYVPRLLDCVLHPALPKHARGEAAGASCCLILVVVFL